MKAVYYYNKYSKVVFITFLIGFTAHGYMFTNKIVNHDDISQLFSVGATVSSGRWGLWLLELLPNYSMPWLNGLISLLFVSIANCFLLEIFEINDKWTQYVLSGITVTFPSLIGIFTYMFTSAAYTFSFMLSVIAVYLVKKKRYFMGAACLIGSLSIYQAYISIAASLLLLVIIRSLLDNKDTIKKEIIKSLQFLLILGISMCLYYLIALVMRHLLHVEFNEYAQRGLSDSIGMSMLIKRIYIAMVNFYYFFSRLNWGLINTYFSLVVHIAGILLVAVCFCVMIKKVNGIKKVFVCAASMLLPLSINCIYLIVAEETVHTLVLFSFFAVYIFSIIVIDTIENWNQAGKIGKRLLLCGLCLVVINNIFVANKTYLKMQLAYENAFSFYTSVITQVKQTEGFDENSKLALVGDADELLYTDTTGNNNIMGVDKSLINVYSRDRFIKYYIGFDISFATEEEIDAIKNSAEFASMSRYPYYGSVSKIGNTIVVKFEQ